MVSEDFSVVISDLQSIILDNGTCLLQKGVICFHLQEVLNDISALHIPLGGD